MVCFGYNKTVICYSFGLGESSLDHRSREEFPAISYLTVVIDRKEAAQVAYSLLCLKQVVFEDGTVWNNANYENWFKAYVGKEIEVDELQNYYPYKYELELN